MVVESNYLIQLVFISSSITFSADLATLKIPLGSPFPGTYLSLRGTAWLTQRISWLDSVCPITRGSAINGTFVASITSLVAGQAAGGEGGWCREARSSGAAATWSGGCAGTDGGGRCRPAAQASVSNGGMAVLGRSGLCGVSHMTGKRTSALW